MKKTVFGIGISSLLILWVLRGVEWDLVWSSFGKVRWSYMILYFLVLFVNQSLRSFRWEILLRPLLRIGQKTLFPVTSVGQMVLLLLPARTGELGRPYLLSQKQPIAMSAALATIVVERILDVITILVFIIFVSFSDVLPPWVTQAGYIAMALMAGILSCLFLLIIKDQWVAQTAERILSPFSQRVVDRIRNFILSFSQGARILTHWRVMLAAFLFSLGLWGSAALLNYVMFFAFALPLSLIAALVLVITVDLGLMIPAAPGFVGSFQFLHVVTLALFGIGREEALSLSLLAHILQILFVIGLGSCFLPMMKIPGFAFIGRKISLTETPVRKQ